MKKIVAFVFVFSLLFSLFAVDNAQNYDTISLYLHSTVMFDTITTSFNSKEESNRANREGVALKVGVDAFKNEDLGAKFGATADICVDYPFRSKESSTITLGKLPYLALSGGILFRSRPWDYIDISLSVKGVVSTYDYKAISLGVSVEPSCDVYFDDYFYLKVSMSYGSDILKFPFNDEYFLIRNNLPSRFSFGVGCGYAFGGYSK